MNNIKKFYEKIYKKIGDMVIIPESRIKPPKPVPPFSKEETSILRMLMEMHERERRWYERERHKDDLGEN